MRQARYLRSRYRAMLCYEGLISTCIGACMLLPLAVATVHPLEPGEQAAFLVPAAVLLVGGLGLWRGLGPADGAFTLPEAGVIVVLGWLIACGAGAVPFMVIESLGPTAAIFESVSGWTTTGLSVIDVRSAHPVVLLWRSTMQLAGGAGLAIIMLAALTGATGLSLPSAEGRSDQLLPNVRASARLVMRIYAGYVAAGVGLLRAAGMGWFDAVNHAFCALSTGGFSTRVESLGYWESWPIEAVTMVLMLLGNLNFVTAWCLLRGKLRAVTHNGEVRLVAVLVPACMVLLATITCVPLYGGAPKAWRVALFETVTALTTTGYSTVSYADWNAFGLLLLIVLMLIGAGACSTGGALKQQRIYLLLRALGRELRRPGLPRTAVTDETIWYGEERVAVNDRQLRGVAAFVFLYLATWLGGSAIMTAYGIGLPEALFEFASTVGTVGLSVGVTGPGLPEPVLWTQIAGMLLGRLEFLVVFASVTKLARDGRVVASGLLAPSPPREHHLESP